LTLKNAPIAERALRFARFPPYPLVPDGRQSRELFAGGVLLLLIYCQMAVNKVAGAWGRSCWRGEEDILAAQAARAGNFLRHFYYSTFFYNNM